MRWAGFCIVILVCECSVSSLVTKQERRGISLPYIFLKSALYSFILFTFNTLFLIFMVIRDKVRPFSAQYGTSAFVSEYGTIPFFKGRLATLPVSVSKNCSSGVWRHSMINDWYFHVHRLYCCSHHFTWPWLWLVPCHVTVLRVESGGWVTDAHLSSERKRNSDGHRWTGRSQAVCVYICF